MTTKQEVILRFLDSCDIKEGDIEESGVMLDLTMIRDFVPEYIAKKAEPVKPRVKVEYVKCEYDYVWQMVKEFEEGRGIYTRKSHETYIKIDNAPDVLRYMRRLYRKVETEITWQDELIDFCKLINIEPRFPMSADHGYVQVSGMMKESEFISMCHLVSSLTK